MAKAGELEQPPVPGPNRLLPYLQFAKFPPKALDVARRVLGDDPDFRARVRAEVDLERIGPAGRLLLEQPAGWEAQLEALEAATAGEAREAKEARQERRATKQLEITREMLEQATTHASDEAAHAARLEAELQAERLVRQRLEARVAGLDEEVEQARVERRRAVSELKTVEGRLHDRTAELHAARQRIAALEDELARLLDRATDVDAGAAPSSEDAPPEPVEQLDREGLGEAVDVASRALDELSAALASARQLLAPAGDVPAGAVAGQARPARRRPVRLPVGVFDDSVEAADALFGMDDMLVMVDGYNVSLLGWPDLPLDVQRDRLIAGLSALEARTGVQVLVVFDGSEAGRHLPPESRLRSVQVRFTEPHVEADDALLAAIERVPAGRPVTVVSSDNRVRRGTIERGANVLSSEQLLAVLRRP